MNETTKDTVMGTTKTTKRELPEGWRWVKLGDVIQEAQGGFACGERDTEGIAQLRMNNLDTRGNFVWDSVLRVPREGNNIAPFLLTPGDVLFNNTNSTELVGKSALFGGYVEPIVYSNHFTRLRTVKDALLPDLLASWLNHQWQTGVFAAICNRWIGQSAVKSDKLLNLEFPLPPLSEQRRIAAILAEQMGAVDAARAAAEARLEAINALPAAFLRQVFPQPGASLPKGWRWVRLGEVCDVVTGSTPPRSQSRYYGGSTPWIKPDDLDRDMFVSASSEYLTREGVAAARLLPEGAVLVSCIGKVGKVAIAGCNLTTNQQINALVPSVEVDSVFLYFTCQQMRSEFERAASAALLPILNKSDFASIKIPLPPLSEQRRIAAILAEQMGAVDAARAAAQAELETINALPAALLRRAFNGEI